MNMKDKLVQTGHKGLYYKVRKYFIFTMLLACVGVGISLTTYFSVTKAVKAEEREKLEEENNSESSEQLVSFIEDPVI